jgi:hypothetical protein
MNLPGVFDLTAKIMAARTYKTRLAKANIDIMKK